MTGDRRMSDLDRERYAAFKRGIGWRISNPDSTDFHEASIEYVRSEAERPKELADDSVTGLCATLGIAVHRAGPLAGDVAEYHFTMPDGIERRMHARSLEEAAEATLWRLLSQLQTLLRRNETREQRIERLADELAKALGR